MNAMLNLLLSVSVFLGIFNFSSGIISGIWLALLGEWGSIGYGILFLIFSAWGLGLILMPGTLLFGMPIAWFSKRDYTLGIFFFGFLSSLYTATVILVWCCIVLVYFLKDATSASLIPRLIWSYGVAIGPWAHMASYESLDSASTLITFFIQIAYIAVIILILFTQITLFQVILVFMGFLVSAIVIQMLNVWSIHKENQTMPE